MSSQMLFSEVHVVHNWQRHPSIFASANCLLEVSSSHHALKKEHNEFVRGLWRHRPGGFDARTVELIGGYGIERLQLCIIEISLVYLRSLHQH